MTLPAGRGRAGHPAQGRALVLGCGFIGRHVASTLAAAGLRVSGLTRSQPDDRARELLGDVEVVVGDVADSVALESVLEGVDHVIYSVGSLLPADSNRAPAHDTVSTLPPLLGVLDALRRRPGVSLTYLSSGGTVYGNPADLPVSEDHPTEPITSYGITRLAGEKYVSMYAELYGVPSRILRCANVYGEQQPPDRSQGAVAAFLDRAARGEPVVVFGDGETVRDYVHVGDAAAVVRDLLPKPVGPRVLNVGTGVGVSLNELIALIGEVTGRDLEVLRAAARPGDVRTVVLDTSRLRSLIDFDPVALRAGIARTWAYLTASPPASVAR